MDELFDRARQQAKGRREPYKEPSMDQMFEKARTSAVQKDQKAQAAQQRAQTIQSMKTKKYELDERKLGVSQPKTQYVSALPILDTVDSVVNPALKQNTPVAQGLRKTVQQYAPAPTLANMGVNSNRLNQSNPLHSRYQSAMPNASLVQQATNNFQQWNKQYKQDEDQYIDAMDRVASLAGWGAPPDEEANRQLEESEAKLNQTKEQQDSMLRQTLTMLGPGAEEIIKAAYKDATDRPGAEYNAQYTQEERERRAQNKKRAQELKKLIGADLYAKLYNYVYEQDTAAKAARKQREEAEAAAQRRHRLEAKYYTLSSVSASKDFKEKSQYHSTAKDSQPSLMTRLIDNEVYGGTSDWDDPLYEAVNGNEEARAYLWTKASNIYGAEGGALGSLYGSATEGKQEVKQMTEEQVGVFNYLYATQGKEVAHEYYELLQELELNPKQRAEEQAYWQQEAEKHQVGSSIFSVAVSPLKVLSAAGQFADYIGSGKIDENAGYNSFARIPNTIRDTVSQKVEEKWGPAGSFLYQTGMSMADFLYNSALTGTLAGEEALGKEAFRLASNMSLAIMGSGAAADATIEAKDRGLTDKQAFVLGTVAGAAEILTEKFSIESLLTGKWGDSAIKFVLKNSLVEGSEEVGSNVINTIADILVSKDKSQWRQSIQAYRNSGLSEAEAFRRAMMDQALEMGLDYLGGSLSGGVMAGMQAWGNRGYWQAQQAPRQTGSTDTNQSGFQTNTQVQTPQDVQQNPFEAQRAPVNPAEVQRTQQNAQTAENTESAKRVELAVDDILTNGTRLMDGTEIPPNQEYIAAKAGIAGGGTAASDVSSQDQLNGPILAAMNELSGQQANQNAEVQQPGKVPAPGAEAEINNQPAHGVGAAESGYSGDIGTWKRDASEFIKDTELPKQDKSGETISDSAGSMFGSNVPNETKETIERYAYEGKYSYEKDVNKAQVERVHKAIEQDGFDAVYERTVQQLTNHRASADTTAQAWVLFIQAANRGDSEKAATLSKLIQRYSTSVAQALQANSIYNKLTPEGRLASIQRTVNRINQDIEAQRGKSGNIGQEVQIDSALLQEYLSAKGKDQIQAVEDKIYKNIASQMPASLGEKARAWRYMGMLANPKTHINNFAGNLSMYVARKGKDTIKAGLEALFLPQDQRTAAVLPGKERRAAAAADYESVKSMILDGDKYSDSANRKIQESRRIFSNSILEGIRVKNDELLNKFGDGIFAKANYTDAFAGILKARGYTAEDFTKGNIPEAQLDSMRAYAIKEAQKATFRDLNSFSRFVRDIGFKNTEGNAFKKGANVAVEGVLAFKKTPANVLARSVEYSPAGLLDALTRESKQLANGDITASQYLDRVSSGVTGTVLFGFGYLLGHWGLIKGGTSDDDEQDKLEGRQNWAIEIGGKSYTLTFLSPMSMPLYMGAQLEQILDGGAGEGPMMDKVLNVLKGISDPILEMSMMSGLQDALKATDYADNKILAFAANAGLSYLTQYIPTLGGQIKRTFQKPQRTTTFVNEADPVLNKDAQRAIGTATNKIPGPSYQQIPYIDAWGRRQDQGNLATRAFNNLVNPMYVSELKQTDVDREIRRLEKQTGKNYTPSRADNVLTIDGETVILTADEYVTYAESRGQNDFEMRSNLIASSTYKTLDDYTKGKTMEYSKEYADNLAEKEIGLNPPTPQWMEELEGKTAEEVTDALIVHALTAQAGNSKDKDKYNEYADQISSGVPEETVLMALTDNQKENYSKYIQKAKVPAETYLDVLSFESKCASDKDKKGKSKKEKVVAYIDGLKLTRKQKRALYLCFYSEKDDTFK